MSAQGLLVETRRAVFSADRRYRYRLSDGSGSRRVLWVMLNPSTADEVDNDPTIRRCIGFTHAWGYTSWEVVNLFAWRATDPRELAKVADPIGPMNDFAIDSAAVDSSLIVFAWGAHPLAKARGRKVFEDLTGDYNVLGYYPKCLGTNADGSPKHPLYLKKDSALRDWP